MERFPPDGPGRRADRQEGRSARAFDLQVFATADTGGLDVVEKALATAYALFRDRDALAAPAQADRDPAQGRRD